MKNPCPVAGLVQVIPTERLVQVKSPKREALP